MIWRFKTDFTDNLPITLKEINSQKITILHKNSFSQELQLSCHLSAIRIFTTITTLKQLHVCAALNYIGLHKTQLNQKQFCELLTFRGDCVFFIFLN